MDQSHGMSDHSGSLAKSIFVRLTHFPIRSERELVRSDSESERNACKPSLIVFHPHLESEKTGLKSYKSETQVGRWIPNNLVVCFRLPIAPRFARRNSPPNPKCFPEGYTE